MFDKMLDVSNKKEGEAEASATFQGFSKDMMHDGQPKHDIDSLAMEDHDGVLTDVGGLSLFPELCMDAAGDMDKTLPNDVR